MPGTSERQQRLPGRNARYVLFTSPGRVPAGTNVCLLVAMTAAQTRLADTIDTFYGAADKTSEGAMETSMDSVGFDLGNAAVDADAA